MRGETRNSCCRAPRIGAMSLRIARTPRPNSLWRVLSPICHSLCWARRSDSDSRLVGNCQIPGRSDTLRLVAMRASLHFILTTAGAALLLGSLAASVRADILYSADFGLGAIQRFTGDGAITYSPPHYPWIVGGLGYVGGLAFDSTGILYVSLSDKIEKFSQMGVDLGPFANTGAGALAFDRAGNLYGVTGNNAITKFTADGVGSVFAHAVGARDAAPALAGAG